MNCGLCHAVASPALSTSFAIIIVVLKHLAGLHVHPYGFMLLTVICRLDGLTVQLYHMLGFAYSPKWQHWHRYVENAILLCPCEEERDAIQIDGVKSEQSAAQPILAVLTLQAPCTYSSNYSFAISMSVDITF